MGIAGFLAKFLSTLLDLPGVWQRWRGRRKDVKIVKLQVEIAKKDARVEADHLHQEFVETHEKNTKRVEDESKTKTLDTIADYFGEP